MSRLAINLPALGRSVTADQVTRRVPCDCQRFRALAGMLPAQTLGDDTVYGPPDPSAAPDSSFSWTNLWNNIDRGISTAANAAAAYRNSTVARQQTGGPSSVPPVVIQTPAPQAQASGISSGTVVLVGAGLVGLVAIALIARR